MDTLTHIFAGVATAHALSRTRPGGAVMASAIVAANVPDLDWLTVSRSLSSYFELHRGIAHSALAIPVLALAVAGATRAIARRHGDCTGFAVLLGVSAAALVTHLALDALNPYGVRPLMPFNPTWRYGDLAAIVDPWIWLVLGGTALLLTGRRLAATRLWVVAGTMIVVVSLRIIPIRGTFGTVAGLVWIAGTGTVLATWIRGVPAAGRRRIAVGGWVALAGYVMILAVCHARAERLASAEAPDAVTLAVIPVVGDLASWRAVAETDGVIYRFDVPLAGARGGTAERFPSLAALDGRDARAVRADPGARAFLSFARFVAVDVARDGGHRTIRLADPRFDDPQPQRSAGWPVQLAVGP